MTFRSTGCNKRVRKIVRTIGRIAYFLGQNKLVRCKGGARPSVIEISRREYRKSSGLGKRREGGLCNA
jgi:hypothetical protein